MCGCPSLGLNEALEPQTEDAWAGILGGDGQGKQGSSQVLFKQGKRWCNGDLTKGLWVTGKREKGGICSLSSLAGPLLWKPGSKKGEQGGSSCSGKWTRGTPCLRTSEDVRAQRETGHLIGRNVLQTNKQASHTSPGEIFIPKMETVEDWESFEGKHDVVRPCFNSSVPGTCL